MQFAIFKRIYNNLLAPKPTLTLALTLTLNEASSSKKEENRLLITNRLNVDAILIFDATGLWGRRLQPSGVPHFSHS